MGLACSTIENEEAHTQTLLALLAYLGTWAAEVRFAASKEQSLTEKNIKCPIAYSKDDIECQDNELERWKKDVDRKAAVLEELGAPSSWDGCARLEVIDCVRGALEKAKEDFLGREAETGEDGVQWERFWPFKDGQRTDLFKVPL